jgi:hypothetical protein
MANTYQLIASNTLTGTTATLTFSSIPATYTDLVLRVSARTARTSNATQQFRCYVNGDAGSTIYSDTYLYGDGATATSTRDSTINILTLGYMSTNAATSNTFGSAELYFPSYTSSNNKPLSSFSAQETNATTAYITAAAGLIRTSSAISSISLKADDSWVSGSSFFLYGIKSS